MDKIGYGDLEDDLEGLQLGLARTKENARVKIIQSNHDY